MKALLMSYGSPKEISREEIRRYYTNVRHGAEPSEELLNDLFRRYSAIGGATPLEKVTYSIVRKVNERLGKEIAVPAFRHSFPFIKDAIENIEEKDMVFSFPLVPHKSSLTLSLYHEEVYEYAKKEGFKSVAFSKGFADNKIFQEAYAKEIAKLNEDAFTIFTAHSIPINRLMVKEDPYFEDLKRSADGIARIAKIHDYAIAFQSAGRTNDIWLGPTVEETIDMLIEKGVKRFLIVPQGFLIDNLETLYDIDIELKEKYKGKAEIKRASCVNDSEDIIRMICEILERLEKIQVQGAASLF
ncbi:MAG: ferrochelatase [Candidatus Micrarchaeaceae archaeon]